MRVMKRNLILIVQSLLLVALICTSAFTGFKKSVTVNVQNGETILVVGEKDSLFPPVYSEDETTTALTAQTTQPSKDRESSSAENKTENNQKDEKTTAPAESGGEKKENNKSDSKNDSAQPQKTTASRENEEKNEISVSFTISCKNAVAYGADVPEYFVSGTTYYGTRGDTVFTALKSVCGDNGISLKYQSKTYIQGIGGLCEKDCGSGSGWMYRVNGVAPSKPASAYKLSDGDTVEWYYVINEHSN